MKNTEKQKSNFYHMNSNYISNQYSSTFSTVAPKSNKYSSNQVIKKDSNVIDFICQKQKFKMQKFFDEKRTKIFLKSKNDALMEIHLEDEIISFNENYDNKFDNNIQTVKKEVTNKEKNKLYKYKSISPRKKRSHKTKNKKENKIKNEKKLKNINNKSTESSEEDNNSIIKGKDDSNEMDCIYKLIINNINENEDNLDKKINKEIQRIESKKVCNKFNSKYNSNFSCSPKHRRKGIKNKKFHNIFESDSRLNPFDFSKSKKDLMINDDIEASSINNEVELNKNNTTKNLVAFNSTNKKKLFDANNLVRKINEMEKNSDHDSLISILSDLK